MLLYHDIINFLILILLYYQKWNNFHPSLMLGFCHLSQFVCRWFVKLFPTFFLILNWATSSPSSPRTNFIFSLVFCFILGRKCIQTSITSCFMISNWLRFGSSISYVSTVRSLFILKVQILFIWAEGIIWEHLQSRIIFFKFFTLPHFFVFFMFFGF